MSRVKSVGLAGSTGLLVVLAQAGVAENARIVSCEAGHGCTLEEATISIEDAAIVYGIDPDTVAQDSHVILRAPDGMGGTIIAADPQQLHEDNGGVLEIPHVIPVMQDGTEQAAIEVFEGDAGADGEIVPEDGLWTVTFREMTQKNCSAMMMNMLQGMAEQPPQSHEIAWHGSNHPDALNFLNPQGQSLSWTQTGPNSYEGEVLANAGENMDISADVGFEVKTPTLIETSSVLNLAMMLQGDPETLAVFQNMGMADCELTMLFDMTKG
ncbi:hypothetical protein HCZ23_05940 [Celeribacter sp. HF31]|uniref:hypothetical protein n=1 Tax=Celeribacter sp. HF31 TaxID=2721558 RepID=UPI001431D440|nr:hypothetical protein [Celeribacter sp. HF31]NIY79006.1 hypothetical protein [Celeribacter sp. HF31]